MTRDNISIVFSDDANDREKLIAIIIFSFIKAERTHSNNKNIFVICDKEKSSLNSESILEYVKNFCHSDNKLKININTADKYITEIYLEKDETKFTASINGFLTNDIIFAAIIIKNHQLDWSFFSHQLIEEGALLNYVDEIKQEIKVDINCNLIDINIYDCHSIMLAIDSYEDLGNLVLYKSSNSSSYINGFKKIGKDQLKIKSLLFCSSEDLRDGNKIKVNESGHYFFKENFYYIRLNNNMNYCIYKWVLAYYYPPSFYFSYAEKDGQLQKMDMINQYITRYFNYIDFVRIDKKPENAFMNLQTYHKNLVSGDIVFLLIGRNFLTRFHPMKELFDALLLRGVFDIDDLSLVDILKYGIIPLITDKEDVRNYLYNDNDNLLKNSWREIKDSSDASINPDAAKSLAIFNAIEKIRIVLQNTFNDKDIDQHINEKCRWLAWCVNKALKSSKKNHINFYKNYKNPDDFPAL